MQQHLTPAEIVRELDKYIIGKRKPNGWWLLRFATAGAGNRSPITCATKSPQKYHYDRSDRRGQTEIARRLARLAQSPFLKIEASKFTEVGYVGRDVESMVRDLTELAVNMVRAEEQEAVKLKAEEVAEEKLLDVLLPPRRRQEPEQQPAIEGKVEEVASKEAEPIDSTREKLRGLLRKGALNDRYVELEVPDRSVPMVEIFAGAGMEDMDFNLREMLGSMLPRRTKRRKVENPGSARDIDSGGIQRLIDMDKVTKAAVERVEHTGIIFLDESIRLPAGKQKRARRVAEGVQRICCRLWKDQRSTPSMAWCAPTTFCSLLREHFISPSLLI